MANPLFNFFGFQIKKNEAEQQLPRSVVAPDTADGQIVINNNTGSGVLGDTYQLAFDPDGQIRNEIDLVRRYRELSKYPEVAEAIEDIVNEAIVIDGDDKPVDLNLDDLKVSDSLKKKITEEFTKILTLLKFNSEGYEIFEQWYVDGKIYFHIILDEKHENGIKELRVIDPRKIKKIKNIIKEKLPTGIEIVKEVQEYYIYNEKGITDSTTSGVRLSVDSVVYCHSGLIDSQTGLIQSYLHKAIKPANQLKMLEEAVIIYRYTRAPERRVFYIDVGNLPKGKAEQYVTDMMNKFKNKLSYDAVTGELADSKRHLSMMEDFWMPRRGDRSTEITTLPGGCLTMDTKVSLLDGRELQIREIENELISGKELWTYSCDEFTGEIKPGLISWAGVTQQSAKVLKLTLDNGETITCTPDHKFPVYGKGFVRADELVIDEQMIPLYRKRENIQKHKKLDYEQVFDNASKKWKYTHRMVHEFVELEEFVYKNLGDFSVTHHADHNRFNNSPTNLVRMSWEDHSAYHADMGFSEEDQKRGTIAAAAKMKWIKENDPQKYQEIIDSFRESMKSWYTNLSEDQYKEFCHKVSVGVNGYIDSLTEEERAQRAVISRKNFKKGTDAFSLRSRTDSNFREEVTKKIKDAWTEERRNQQSENSTRINYETWGNHEKTTKRRENHKKTQKFEYDRTILVKIIDLVKGKTQHQITLKDVVASLNTDENMLNLMLRLHENKRIPMWKPEYGFTAGYVISLVVNFGYESWGDFRKKESLYNHRIVNIEWLENETEVGTLTIDGYEIIHAHHTFALSAGIFTKNSGLGNLDDLDYFKDKLYHALNVPKSRFNADTGFSIGRSDTISRDEIKFQKFVTKLRNKFTSMFMDILRVQLISKGVFQSKDWEQLKEKIQLEYAKDNFFSELKENEVLNARLQSVAQLDPFVGKYISKAFIQRNVMRFTDEEMKQLDTEIAEERKQDIKNGLIPDPADMQPQFNQPPADGTGEGPQ